METLNRHPLYMAADMLKEVFFKLGYQFKDNGEGLEIETPDVSFATWEEPANVCAWQGAPIYLRDKAAVLRTRILPAHLKALDQALPIRIVTFGRVYPKDTELYRRSHIEGFVAEDGLTPQNWSLHWNHFAVVLFGLGSSATLTSAGNESYKIILRDTAGKEFELGYTGPPSKMALDAAGIKDECAAWVFVIDVDQFAVKYCSLPNRASLYNNDVAFLSQFNSNAASVGNTLEYRAADALRMLGYTETCGHAIYPDGIYKKMNMIQEEWDLNNQPFPLVEPLGALTDMRTVLTPSLEENLALNYQHGAAQARTFEIGHIYLPIEGQLLPKEHIAVGMAAYSPDITLESFTADVSALLKALGIEKHMFAPTDLAIAYEKCLVVLDGNGTYLHSNFGQISEKATKNFGIGVPAYMANFELASLAAASKL